MISDANSLEGSVGDVAINGNLFPDAEDRLRDCRTGPAWPASAARYARRDRLIR